MDCVGSSLVRFIAGEPASTKFEAEFVVLPLPPTFISCWSKIALETFLAFELSNVVVEFVVSNPRLRINIQFGGDCTPADSDVLVVVPPVTPPTRITFPAGAFGFSTVLVVGVGVIGLIVDVLVGVVALLISVC